MTIKMSRPYWELVNSWNFSVADWQSRVELYHLGGNLAVSCKDKYTLNKWPKNSTSVHLLQGSAKVCPKSCMLIFIQALFFKAPNEKILMATKRRMSMRQHIHTRGLYSGTNEDQLWIPTAITGTWDSCWVRAPGTKECLQDDAINEDFYTR